MFTYVYFYPESSSTTVGQCAAVLSCYALWPHRQTQSQPGLCLDPARHIPLRRDHLV